MSYNGNSGGGRQSSPPEPAVVRRAYSSPASLTEFQGPHPQPQHPPVLPPLQEAAFFPPPPSAPPIPAEFRRAFSLPPRSHPKFRGRYSPRPPPPVLPASQQPVFFPPSASAPPIPAGFRRAFSWPFPSIPIESRRTCSLPPPPLPPAEFRGIHSLPPLPDFLQPAFLPASRQPAIIPRLHPPRDEEDMVSWWLKNLEAAQTDATHHQRENQGSISWLDQFHLQETPEATNQEVIWVNALTESCRILSLQCPCNSIIRIMNTGGALLFHCSDDDEDELLQPPRKKVLMENGTVKPIRVTPRSGKTICFEEIGAMLSGIKRKQDAISVMSTTDLNLGPKGQVWMEKLADDMSKVACLCRCERTYNFLCTTDGKFYHEKELVS